MTIFGYRIGKECGGKWFPNTGRGYWDGWHYYLFRVKHKVNLKFRRLTSRRTGKVKGWAIGPLMVWKES